MLRRVIGLTLAFALILSGAVFAASTGEAQNTTTYTTSTSTSTSHTTVTTTSSVGNIWMGYTIDGFAYNESHPEWDGNYTYSYRGNYSSTLELLLQGHPDSYTSSGNYWAATHPAATFVSQGGRGAVINEGSAQYMGTNNVAVSATTYTGTTVTQGQSQSVTTSSNSLNIGVFTLTNYTVNTNTNTNTNYEADYLKLTGNLQTDVYEVNSTCWVSPIVLDLSGTGKLDASAGKWLPHNGMKGNRVALFDIRGNDSKMLMEWVGPQMGLLVEPKADGSVDGTCLFGDAGGFDNGYQKLSLRDKDGNRLLQGAELKGLAIWTDVNGNGKCDQGELHSLTELKITMLDLRHNNLRSTFTMNGKTATMWDWYPTALDVRRVSIKK